MIPVSAGVIGTGIILIGLGLFSAFCVLRFAAGRLAASGPGRGRLVLAACGAGLLAFGCRLSIAGGHVSWVPYLDQWGAEISGLVAPLAHGTLGWRDLAAGNNEHRVLLTRALSLAVIQCNGAWDNRVMVIGNYLLDSLLVAWVCGLAWSYLGWVRGSFVGAAALLPMLLVCGWEGIVSSNQTQFVFLAFGSVVALSLCRSHSLGSLESWGALAAALLTLGSMVSGFLTPLAMMATALIMAPDRRRVGRSVAGFCALCAAVAALGWLTRVHFSVLHFIYAKSAGEWLDAFLAYGAWPMPASFLGLLCLWLPWCILLARALGRREPEPAAPFAFGLGLWVLLQAGALAWARAGLSGLVSSRYTEFLGWGLVANALSMAIVLKGPGAAGRGRLVAWAAMAVWLAGVGGCEVWRSQAVYRPYYEAFRGQSTEQESRLGTFMRTGDAGVITGAAFPQIPHYSPELIVSLLGDPQVQGLLPGPLRRDLVRDREPSVVSSVRDGPLSLAAVHALRDGPWIAAAGAAVLLAAFGCARRPAAAAAPPGDREAAR
jgi:hypothetical protein